MLGRRAILLQLPFREMIRLARRAARLGNAELLVLEHAVHVLQTPLGGLGVEEVGDGYETGVEDGPDDVELVPEVFDGAGGDVDDDEVGQPVGADAERDPLVAGAERHDFRGVHPAHGQDTPREDVEEEEGEGYKDPVGLQLCLASCSKAGGRSF